MSESTCDTTAMLPWCREHAKNGTLPYYIASATRMALKRLQQQCKDLHCTYDGDFTQSLFVNGELNMWREKETHARNTS